MQLWQNQRVVESLNQILTDYDYLEYDEEISKQDIKGIEDNGLHVKVIHQNAARDSSDACDICGLLGQITGRLFYPIFFSLGSNHQDRIIPSFKDYHPIFFLQLDNEWVSFDIHEYQYR